MNILIAEDNETNRRVATKVAESLGHTVQTAENGLEAVKAATDQRYDVILMDVQMPIMDGLEATRRIVGAADPKDRPHIIAVTANAIIGDRETCLAAGMDDYLAKPLRIEPLRAALAKVDCPSHPVVSGSFIDLDQFRAIMDPEDSECMEIFEDFCGIGKQQLSGFVALAEQQDWQGLSDVAHQLKGSSSTFGFLLFSERMSEIEADAKSGGVEFTAATGEELATLFNASVEEVLKSVGG